MRRPLRAITTRAFSSMWPAVLLGLVGGLVIVLRMTSAGDGGAREIAGGSWSTWPIVPLVFAAAWGGMAATGAARAQLAHAFARPVSRGTWLATRLALLLVLLTMAGIALHLVAAQVWIRDPGPPFILVVGAILGAALAGALAGATAETEATALGGTVLGVALLYAPAQSLLDAYAISWPRLVSGMGPWAWPIVLLTTAGLAWPVWQVVRALPRRDARASTLAGALAVAIAVFGFVTMWWPAAARATGPEHAGVVAISGEPGAPSVVYTGSSGHVEGVLMERNGELIALYGGGIERPRIMQAIHSPDGRRLAMMIVPPAGTGRQVVVLDLESGDRLESKVQLDLKLGAWSPEGLAFAFTVPGEPGGYAIVDAELGDLRLIPAEPPGRILAWREEGLLVSVDGDPSGSSLGLTESGQYRAEMVSVTRHRPGHRTVVAGSISSAPFAGPGALAWTSTSSGLAEKGSSQRHLILSIRGLDSPGDDIDVELDARLGAIVHSRGWLDAEHVYLTVHGTRNVASNGRLVIVRRDGALIADAPAPSSLARLNELLGPPAGPWLGISSAGSLFEIACDGRTTPRRHGIDLGSRDAPWVPTRHGDRVLSLVDPGSGNVVTETLPWSAEAR